MSNLDNIKARILKLSQMTVENGCSESEAMTAASKLAAILDENGMTAAEIKSFSDEKSGNKMETGDFNNNNKKKLHEVQFCVSAIARFFDVKLWANRSNVTGATIKFFGFPADVAAAISLTETLVYAMESDYRKWVVTQDSGVHGKTLRKNFMLGFAVRVSNRLDEMKKERNVVATGTALVVLKNQVVETEMEKLNLNLRKGTASRSTGNTAAYEAGMSAGNRVNLGNSKYIAN